MSWVLGEYVVFDYGDIDHDGDGLSTGVEQALGTRFWDPDTDDDRYSDLEELLAGCLPDDPASHPGPGGTGCMLVDSDADGLSDNLEEAFGTGDVLTDDYDGDGISDLLEVIYGYDPAEADTDGDGLLDGVEDADGNGVVDSAETDPTEADTDGDGLLDGEEDADHDGVVDPGETDPTNPNTDGDDYTDFEEVVGGSNPNDPADIPAGMLDEVLHCETVFGDRGTTFQDVVEAGTWTGAGSPEDYYGNDYDSSWGGTECRCDFQVSQSGEDRQFVGVTVWIPTTVFDDTASIETDYDDEPRPQGVLVVPPWAAEEAAADPSGAEELTYGFSYGSSDDPAHLGAGNAFEYDDDDELAAAGELPDTPEGQYLHWFAFGTNPQNPDGPYGLDEVAPRALDGTWTVWVSYVNTLGAEMYSCEDLLDGRQGGRTRLKFRVDTRGIDEEAADAVADRHACVPGATGRTTFDLLHRTGEVASPIYAGGEVAYAGAEAVRIEVTDWRGADRLVVRSAGIGHVELDPAHPSAVLDTPLPLEWTTWRANRSTEGAWTAPVVRVDHACPEDAAPMEPPDRYAASWAQVAEAVAEAAGQEVAAALLPAVQALEADAVRVQVLDDGAGHRSLGLFTPAGGLEEAFALTDDGAGGEFFTVDWDGLRLEGRVVELEDGLELSLVSGEATWDGVALDLAPVTLTLR